MNYDKEKGEVFCHICEKWLDLNTETLWLSRDDDVVEIRCEKCNVLLGYDYDIDL